jgi:hypothetical protein
MDRFLIKYRRKDSVFAVTTVLLSLAVSLVLSEAILRAFAPAWLEYRMAVLNPEATAEGWGSDAAWPVERRNGSFYSWIPSSSFSVSHLEYKTTANIDELGGRVVPSSSASKSNPLLPFLGDSFTFGIGVNDDETFVSKIADKIQHFRVLNLGVPETALTQQIELIDRRHHDLGNPQRYIFFFFLGNDFDDMISAEQATVHEKKAANVDLETPYPILIALNNLATNTPILRQSYLLQLARQFGIDVLNRMRQRDGALPVWDASYYIMDKSMEAYRSEAQSALKKQLNRLISLQKTMKFKSMIVAIPDVHQVDASRRKLFADRFGISTDRLDPRLPNQLLADALRTVDIPLFDATECIANGRNADSYYYQRDTHFRPAGHEALARCVINDNEVRRFLDIPEG